MPSSFSSAGSSDASTARKRAMQLAPVLDEDRRAAPRPSTRSSGRGDRARRPRPRRCRRRASRGSRARANTRTAASRIRVRLSAGAIERSVNAHEDRGTLRRRATAAGMLVVDFTRYLPGRVRESRARATRRARRPRRAAGGRSDAPDRDRLGHGASRRQRVRRLRPPAATRRSRGRSARAPTSCSRASGRESPRASASGPTTSRTTTVYCSITGFGDDATPSPARGSRRQLPRLGGRPRGHGARRSRRSRSPTSPPARSAR